MNLAELEETFSRIAAPTLPPELERRIFKNFALSCPAFIPKLMLVAWRVKEWVEPLLYRTIIIDDSRSQHTSRILPSETMAAVIRSKPATFFCDSVRKLMIHPTLLPPYVKAILSVCTGVQNLYSVHAGAVLIDLSSDIPLTLKHLYTRASPLLDSIPYIHLAHLTHLELIGQLQFLKGMRGDILRARRLSLAQSLAQLPQLTHLSFNEKEFVSWSLLSLRNCTSLAVVVFLAARFKMRDIYYDNLNDELAAELRFVAITTDLDWSGDWKSGAGRGIDYWSRAEKFIANRRSGEANPLCCEMTRHIWDLLH